MNILLGVAIGGRVWELEVGLLGGVLGGYEEVIKQWDLGGTVRKS